MNYVKENVDSILNDGVNRRGFLKGLAACGALSMFPGGNLLANESLNTKIPYLGKKVIQLLEMPVQETVMTLVVSKHL